jgi:hypothetical protein
LAWTIVLWARAAPLWSALDDEVGHFLLARDAWEHPGLMLNLWGRTGTTLSFMLPAAAGLGVARAAALAMSAATVLVATAVARFLGVRALALVPIFLWFQPWFHHYGNTVLTEIPMTLAMVAACWAALAERRALASLLFGVLPLMRHEGIAVLGLWGLLLIWRRDWRLLALALAPFVLYHAIFSLVFWEPPFAVYFRTNPTRFYGHGGWLHYALPLARSLGPPVALLAAAGLWLGRRDRRLVLLAAPYVLYALVEVIIFRFGLFGSAGSVVFLFPVAPFAAVAAAVGTEQLIALLERAPHAALRGRASAPLLLGAVLALAAVGYGLRSNPASADSAAGPMRQAVRFLEARHVDVGRVTATHVWFFELSGADVPTGDKQVTGIHSPWSRPTRPRRLRPGALAVWDCFYSDRFGLRWRRLAASGFRVLARFGGGRVVVLRRGGRGRAPGHHPRCRA